MRRRGCGVRAPATSSKALKFVIGKGGVEAPLNVKFSQFSHSRESGNDYDRSLLSQFASTVELAAERSFAMLNHKSRDRFSIRAAAISPRIRQISTVINKQR
jgi:hypothetical protein